jgi:deoxyribose-phosphate aldolase
MTNGNYERLVEQITDLVLSKLDGGSNDYCPSFCRADVERIVDAGASRIGIVLGETATAHDWASLIDHTLLKPEASESDIKKLCNEAVQFGFASVCVNPTWVKRAAEFLSGSSVPVCTVIGFPLGATLPDVKAYETRRAIFNGAREVDMVINIGALKSGDDCAVEEDIRAVATAAHENGVLCKVIIATALSRLKKRGR